MATAEEVYGRDIAFKADYVPSPTGDLEMIAGLENVKEALLRRLVTSPGSLIHRPNYGVGIKSFQGRLNSLAAQRELAARIVSQYLEDTRVEAVTNVGVVVENDRPDLIQILVTVTLAGYGEQTLNFIPFEEA